ncbi:DNA-binding transcriptional regulator, AcrR family [Robiginitalea myxolifaciens]|uniref:DNA-binding transcriptional regulator, AcrR family n=1 Tax=Robiginitalea myxolifaciens TaxID=400055 RepID=A0A1I6HDG2_9FLAO|nr:TetR/AcrR family transcriptional regulator [Robiginitalea myxolifaciens]SFR52489.1 DNA-binding transcriptional regulator, AcrR family [Robiginitalea myxolifaciens]
MDNAYLNTGRTNQKQETRDKILRAAQHFLDQGIDFSLEDVARQSGISRATVYRYYSNAELLAGEAVLDIKTKKPQLLAEEVKDRKLEDQILSIHDYYNGFAIANENAFRKYLATTLSSEPGKVDRGARRVKTLELVLQDSDFTKAERQELVNIFTVLMGVEPLIVMRDVCGLDVEESRRLLRLGSEMLLKGFLASKKV